MGGGGADEDALEQIEDADVCAGAVGTQAPILAHDLRSISLASHAAKNFCSTVFGLCPLQEVIPYAVNFTPFRSEGELEVGVTRERKHERRWKSKGGKPFQVVHISDVHIDRSYLVSAASGTRTRKRS